MTTGAEAPRVKGYLIQILMLFSINVPTISFGLAMGWVSLASGERSAGGERGVVVAAAGTFLAGLAGAPLAARVLRHGRRPALLATSAAFGVSWALAWGGAWGAVVGRLVAGVAGAAAWCVAPLMARETCSAALGGAGAAALVAAHNLGVLLMLAAGDAALHHTSAAAWCVALSALHCAGCMFMPESRAFLAAHGRIEEARTSLAWLRGVARDHPALEDELRALPPPDEPLHSPLHLARDMLSDVRRRRAFVIALVAVVGQEACGVLSLLQFAERVFVLARDEGAAPAPALTAAPAPASPARHALVLGAVQFVASAAALYLVERVGRRPLLVVGAMSTGAGLALGAWCAARGGAGWGGERGAAAALAAAVGADSAGLQPAPYALLADMFHYQYRGCAVLLITVAASLGNAAETLLFPLVAHTAGLWAALALAATATLLYAVFAIIWVPETKGRTPEQIYDVIYPEKLSSKDQQKSTGFLDIICSDKSINDRQNSIACCTKISNCLCIGRGTGNLNRDEVDETKTYYKSDQDLNQNDHITSDVKVWIQNNNELNIKSVINNKDAQNVCELNIDTEKIKNDIMLSSVNKNVNNNTASPCSTVDESSPERTNSNNYSEVYNEAKQSRPDDSVISNTKEVIDKSRSSAVAIVETLHGIQTDQCCEQTQCTKM